MFILTCFCEFETKVNANSNSQILNNTKANIKTRVLNIF